MLQPFVFCARLGVPAAQKAITVAATIGSKPVRKTRGRRKEKILEIMLSASGRSRQITFTGRSTWQTSGCDPTEPG